MLNKAIFTGYENTELLQYDKINDGLDNTVYYDELKNAERAGVLKANLHKDGRLLQLYSEKENHVGVIAATRLGKTTSYVIPTIISFARQNKKRSMIISDPKGELYRLTSQTLRDEGYNVFLLNFRDYLHSECWNPLTPIYHKYIRTLNIENEVTVEETDHGLRNRFRGRLYESQLELDEDIERVKSLFMEEIGSDIDKIAQMVCPTTNTKDAYWEDSARELTKAFIWGMLEDTQKKNNPITEDTFSFSTIVSIMTNLHDGNGNTFDDSGYFTDRSEDSRALMLAKDTIIQNASTTRKCITSIFNSRLLSVFKESTMRLITRCNSFTLDKLIEGPTAIFIDYHDELKVHYKMISLFIQNAYTYLIRVANSKPSGKLDVPFYFILDEFGNFPEIIDFDTVVSACGGRNIFFILILQSYAQLNNVYGENVAGIIRDNLNVHVFFGSNNHKTLYEFSEECGKTTRLSPISALSGGMSEELDPNQIETTQLIPISTLSNLKPGECIVTEANSGFVMFSKMERYFMCDEFKSLPQSDYLDYKCTVDALDKKYEYSYHAKKKDDDSDSSLF